MLVSTLASSSEGNSTYVETNDCKILIDIGTNLKYINSKLGELGISIEEIDFLFLTHTHKDHSSALESFIKKANPRVLLSKNMYNELEYLSNYDNVDTNEELLSIGTTTIDFFRTSHDAVDARGCIIEDATSSLVYMTDTGYLNQRYFKKLYNKGIYIIEANHDVEMLINGKYPKWLKSRILSDKGHLSNNACGFYLSKLIGPDTKEVILAHLSKENNTEEAAIKTVEKTLKEYDIEFKNIKVAPKKERMKEIVY